MAKARVARLKIITIPRLELCAVKLLSELLPKVLAEMRWADCEYTLWSDSQVVLHWLRKSPSVLKNFVANRVSEIQSNTEIERWCYVNTKHNPADLVSRGLMPGDIVRNELWLHGPEWLAWSKDRWPQSVIEHVEDTDMKPMAYIFPVLNQEEISIYVQSTEQNVPLLEYEHTLNRAINVLSYVYRFVSRAKSKSKIRQSYRKDKSVTVPTSEEKYWAIQYIIRQEQNKDFSAEIRALKSKEHIQYNSKIESLKPLLDSKGILRVGGRLSRADETYELKHPMIVKAGSRLSWLIMDDAHRATKHGAVQVMIQDIRQRYWIPRIRNELRSFVHKCVTCARHNKRFEQQLMSELPQDRVQVGKPFLHTGVDYAGPFNIKMIGNARQPAVGKKCWVAIFVCLKTRAVHIDTVTDLTSVAFISCFERFICRRGRCERIYSDNGTTFVGANKELKRAVQKWQVREVFEHLSVKGTEWRFMTPSAPHQGGIYEAAVKSMKHHLTRVVGQRTLSYEQFSTLLSEIEAILNSRPLTPLSDDVTESLWWYHYLLSLSGSQT